MNIKKNIVTLSLTMLLALSSSANASKLPNDIFNYVKGQLPQAQQRFDSVLVINDDLMYIPLTPPTASEVSEIKVEYSYPENKNLKDMPEVLLLNNGYSFLKVFKDEKGNYTLTKKDDLPIKVRLGLMPQDMLTPIGLKMPESLKLTLGDLLIPTKEEGSLALKDDEKGKSQNPYSATIKRNEFVAVDNFKDKKVFINPKNSKFLAVYDNSQSAPLYELKLSAMPFKIITSETSKVALVLYWNSKKAEIIDLNNERVVNTIEFDANASDVALDKKNNVAYVASQEAHAIYLINLNAMQLERVIKIDQKPTKIAYCEKDGSISFYDEYLEKAFNIEEQRDNYSVYALGDVSNVSEVVADENNVYTISRTQNELIVFSKNDKKMTNTIQLDRKPIDSILYNSKLYILCAKDGFMNVVDTLNGKVIKREKIADEGFYSKMILIPGENSILITGINSKTYLIYDLDKMQVANIQDSYVNVSNIMILDKAQRL